MTNDWPLSCKHTLCSLATSTRCWYMILKTLLLQHLGWDKSIKVYYVILPVRRVRVRRDRPGDHYLSRGGRLEHMKRRISFIKWSCSGPPHIKRICICFRQGTRGGPRRNSSRLFYHTGVSCLTGTYWGGLWEQPSSRPAPACCIYPAHHLPPTVLPTEH